ncbi:MAG: hypothetical protein BIFFINMI_02039 [Phycisphaerae bacterium]|nr:hypothetical protein [Phycisphaerae bacterium]
MAILLKCHQCQEQLEVDDAFAGGICRCVHCGALSHVPHQRTELDRKGRPKTPPPMAKPVVASEAELDKMQIVEANRFVAAQKRRGLLAIAMIVVAVGLAVILIWLLRQNKPEDDGTKDKNKNYNPPGAVVVERKFANLCGLTLPAGPTAYLLDTGHGIGMSGGLELTWAKVVIEMSLASQGDAADKCKFVVSTWEDHKTFMGESVEAPKTFPETGLSDCTEENRNAVADWLTPIRPGENTYPAPAVELALARGATVIVLIVKSDLTAEQADAIGKLTAGKSVTLRAVAFSLEKPETFANLAKAVGGAENVSTVTVEQLEKWQKEPQ